MRQRGNFFLVFFLVFLVFLLFLLFFGGVFVLLGIFFVFSRVSANFFLVSFSALGLAKPGIPALVSWPRRGHGKRLLARVHLCHPAWFID